MTENFFIFYDISFLFKCFFIKFTIVCIKFSIMKSSTSKAAYLFS